MIMKTILITIISLFSIKSCFNSNSFKLIVAMEDAADLKAGNKVKCKGVEVGEVNNIQIVGNKVYAEIGLNNDFHPVKGTTAQVNFENLLGGKSLVLYPAETIEMLASGDTIYATKNESMGIIEDVLKKNIPIDSIMGNFNLDSIGSELLKDTASINKMKDAAEKIFKLKDLIQ